MLAPRTAVLVSTRGPWLPHFLSWEVACLGVKAEFKPQIEDSFCHPFGTHIYFLGPVLGLQGEKKKKTSTNIGPIFTLFASTCVTGSRPPCSKSNFMNQYVYIETESKICYLKIMGLALLWRLYNNETNHKGNFSDLRFKVIFYGRWLTLERSLRLNS